VKGSLSRGSVEVRASRAVGLCWQVLECNTKDAREIVHIPEAMGSVNYWIGLALDSSADKLAVARNDGQVRIYSVAGIKSLLAESDPVKIADWLIKRDVVAPKCLEELERTACYKAALSHLAGQSQN
jgi:hypothetical protein